MSKEQKRKKAKKSEKKRKNGVVLNYKKVAELYEAGYKPAFISKKMGVNAQKVSDILQNKKTKEYLKKIQKTQKQRLSAIIESLTKLIERQVRFGGLEKTVYFDKHGNKVSTKITRKALGIRELVEMSKLAGLYPPSLKVERKEDKEESNEEAIKRLKERLKLVRGK